MDENIRQEILRDDGSHTFRDSLNDHIDRVKKVADESVAIHDDYGNSLLSIGRDDESSKFTHYSFDNDTLNWWLWTTLYNDSWVFKRAIDKPSQDMIRCGITLNTTNDVTKVYEMLTSKRTDFVNLLQWGSLYGGSIACIMFDNLQDEDYKKPLNIETVRKAKAIRLYVVDRWYGVSPSPTTVDNMLSLDFGKPVSYKVSFPDGHEVTFHHDYVLRYEHRTAPKLIKCGMLQGWGYAEGSHIVNELMRDEKLKNSIQSLVDKSLIEVIKMSGMRGVFMGNDPQSNQQLQQRLEMVNWARNFNSLTFLDKDDDYQEHGFSGLSGLSDLLQENMWQIAAALEMQGVLFGDLKSGFSNDSEALERYDETINNRCEAYLRPVYDKFLTLMYQIYGIDEKPVYTFNSLLVKKNNDDKMEGIQKFAQMLSQMLQDGVIDLQQYGESMNSFVQDGTVDLHFTPERLEKLKETQVEENEMFGESLTKKVNE